MLYRFVFATMALSTSFPAFSSTLSDEFELSFLAGTSAKADLSHLITSLGLPLGEHEVALFINHQWKGEVTVLVSSDSTLSIRTSDVQGLGLKLKQEALDAAENSQWIAVSLLTSGVQSQFDAGLMRLDLQVPQASLSLDEVGYVHPQFWQEGENALLLSYNTNFYRYVNKKKEKFTQDNFYLSLRSGFNLGKWHFRDDSHFSYQNGSKNRWHNNARYLQRGIAKLEADLKIGDFYTSSELFSALPFRGLTLTTDNSMRPSSQQGFAPIVRGVAKTNALVSIYQSETLIYQENVPPGEFALSHLQPTGSGGDLKVVVLEADGEEQQYTIPFSAVPGMIKAGSYTYQLAAGEPRLGQSAYRPNFVQGEGYYGVSNLVTLYGGTLISSDYYSLVFGSGWNLPIGALSFDVSHASAQLPNSRKQGQSYRLSYSKFLDTTATNFTLAAYRYSTKGYYSFTDLIYAKDRYQQTTSREDDNALKPLDLSHYDSLRGVRPRNTFSLNVNQRLTEGYGSFYFTGTQRDYWSETGKSREFQFGYANRFKKINYNFSVAQYRQNGNETRFYLNFTVPLSLFDNSAYFSASTSMTREHYQQTQVSLSGTAGTNNQLNYAFTGTNSTGGEHMASVNLHYRARYAALSGSYSESGQYRQLGLGAQGSIVALPWHVVVGNSIGDTYSVIKALKAENYIVNGDSSIVTNQQGLALTASVAPYRRNMFTLSQTPESIGAEVLNNVAYAVPYRGSVTKVDYETDSRTAFLLKAQLSNGQALPFGTEVLSVTGQHLGVVGQSGLLYLKLDSDKLPSELKVSLGSQEEFCKISQPKLSLVQADNLCYQ